MKQKETVFSSAAVMKKCLLFFVSGTIFLFVNCGLDEYPSIDPVPQSYISRQLNNWAEVRIPDQNTNSFQNYVIFYRIYVSDVLEPSTTTSVFNVINPVLDTDYSSIRQYIDSTTLVNVNMESFFTGRNFHYLELFDDHDINAVLSSSSSGYPTIYGKTLIFDFSSGRDPVMSIGSTEYTLRRSNGNGLFSPQPNRTFRNSEGLYASANINSNTNADVVNKSGINNNARCYTYAAFYIVAEGIDSATYSNIYSTPSLIHVFQLPDN